MPATTHPQARFDPLPLNIDIAAIVEKHPNLDFVLRVDASQIEALGLAEFEKLITTHVINGGKPIVVEGWQRDLPPWLFSAEWLQDNVGGKIELVRDITNAINMEMTVGHYLNAMEKLTRQWTPDNFRDPKRQRFYLKDIDCPAVWQAHLEKLIPPQVYYLNDTTGEKGGPGAQVIQNEYNQSTKGKAIGPAGDLMSNLPPAMRAENLQCYIGHEGTYTPAHREMCATLGHNLMVETSEKTKGECDGSSLWFMTESKDRELVSEYFLSMLGHDIEVEKHFAQINAWKKAPFTVYFVEQKVGDFIFIPPLAPHQVWNRGQRTMKVAWNRTTVETLELALREALPNARMVCRDEQYKCKAIVYYSLLNYSQRLQRVLELDQANYGGERVSKAPKVRQLRRDFKRLFLLYTEIMVSETFSPHLPKEKRVEFAEFDSNITCSYCRCNIFNRFLTCKTCVGELADGDEDTYDICMECYAMGRSCACISNLTWVEQWKWDDLVDHHREWRELIITFDRGVISDKSPLTLDAAMAQFDKKSVAHICQEQLKRRPWHDINKSDVTEVYDSNDEPEVDEDGRIKKKKITKKMAGELAKNSASCHICLHKELKWKTAQCSNCILSYCYGVLWRAFDLKPQTIMEDPNWKCPKCLQICSCGKCRKDPTQKPYRPKGTLLGHDTKKVADPRSVESLVDFGRANLSWLRNDGDEAPGNSQRMQALKLKAAAEKALSASGADEEHVPVLPQDERVAPEAIMQDAPQNNMFIDPSLMDDGQSQFNAHGDNSSVEYAGLLNGHDSQSMFWQDRNGGYLYHDDYHDHNGTPDIPDNDGTIAPGATVLDQHNLHIEPSAMSRMMGQGYYQQENTGSDRILFDHPGAETPNGEHINTDYPRLPDELGGSTTKKRKRDDMPHDPAEVAHLQYQAERRKQKLTAARKSNKYFMVKHKLEGGLPRIIKLSLPGNQEFLARLNDAQIVNPSIRHNPRPPRLSVGESIETAMDVDEPAAIVASDSAPPSAKAKDRKSVYQEPSDGEAEFNERLDPSDSGPSHKRRKKAIHLHDSEEPVEESGLSRRSSARHSAGTTAKPMERRRSSYLARREAMEAAEAEGPINVIVRRPEAVIVAPPPSARTQSFTAINDMSRPNLLSVTQVKAIATPVAIPAAAQAAMTRTQKQPGRRVTFNESESYGPAANIDSDASTGIAPSRKARTSIYTRERPEHQGTTDVHVSDTLDAKMRALQEAEEEIAAEERQNRNTPGSPRPGPAQSRASDFLPKAFPPAVPGQLLSMRERAALAKAKASGVAKGRPATPASAPGMRRVVGTGAGAGAGATPSVKKVAPSSAPRSSKPF